VLSLGLKLLNDYPKAELFNGDYSLVKYTSPTMVICAVALLCLFAKIELKDGVKKLVAIFSPFAFSVYLIHTAPFVWSKVMKNRFVSFTEYNPFVMVILIFVTAVGIFALCSLIDYIRIKIFNLLKIKELSAKLGSIIEKYVDKFLNKKEFEQIDS
jgi:surface polysaccharide O-acyltransferase-like enzyme